MAATDSDVKNFDAKQFALEIKRHCDYYNGKVFFDAGNLTNDSLENLADGLGLLFEERPDYELKLKKLFLSRNKFNADGLRALAKGLRGTTLEGLFIDDNENLTTLAPLVHAGVLSKLKILDATHCSFSAAEDVLPPELCANLTSLGVLYLGMNSGNATVTLTEEALCALPADCKVAIGDTKARVKLGTEEFKILPTEEPGMFYSIYPDKAKTAKEILTFAGVTNCQPLTAKPAQTLGTGTGIGCGACSSPRPRFACAACKTEAYCNDRCQKLAWASHKNACF